MLTGPPPKFHGTRDILIDALTTLDKGEAGRSGPNPDRFDYLPPAIFHLINITEN